MEPIAHFLNTPLQIGNLILPHRLIQGPLAGVSAAKQVMGTSLFSQSTHAKSATGLLSADHA